MELSGAGNWNGLTAVRSLLAAADSLKEAPRAWR